jgi:hypothetical protein
VKPVNASEITAFAGDLVPFPTAVKAGIEPWLTGF